MRRHGDLFTSIVSSTNLWRAWRTFQRGKRHRPSVLRFEQDADRQVVRLHRGLTSECYRPGDYRLFPIWEPKRRLIAAAAVRDRVVHHALHRVLAPLLDPNLIHTTYACLPNRGSHRALLAYLAALRRYRCVLMLDIRHYFLSIDCRILMTLMARHIKDRPLLALLEKIVASGTGIYHQPGVADFLGLSSGFPPANCGLPIGNLTSQWWGNHYLSGFDHFAKRVLKIPHYQRYMDDLVLFQDSRAQLEDAREAAKEWLWRERRLRLKHPNAPPKSTKGAFTYLGYRVTRAGVHPTRTALRRMQNRISELVLEGDEERIQRSVAAYRGILAFVGGSLTASQ